ncbi:hypothetical protein KC726_01550 [Candidatus Woesebacteria bacterium]|nr:hypothetical protein [Candidatus Woesebacteria bacterium]
MLQILRANKGNIAVTSRILHTTRKTIYKALKKQKEQCLDDASTAPSHVANKTTITIEEKVVTLKA